VLISAPSDKLNLAEGSSGPLLSCEAAGEPQVQYRWLLLRGSGGNLVSSSDLVASRYNVKHFSDANSNNASQQEPSPTSAGANRRPAGRPNDATDQRGQPDNDAAERRLVELTGASAGEQVGGTSVAVLDLSAARLDRKQSGHYICEASNGLGQTRQSVYVNVLCKYDMNELARRQARRDQLTRAATRGAPLEGRPGGGHVARISSV
jgi:hypothetical protein